jgi:hypothetical protein
MSSFVKIRPVGAELFHTDRRREEPTVMTKLTVGFRYSANSPEMVNLHFRGFRFMPFVVTHSLCVCVCVRARACVCACVRACARACARACVHVCLCVCVCVCVCTCVRVYLAPITRN